MNLFVKEVRLQSPGIFVALVCVAFSLVTYLCRNIFPADINALDIHMAGHAVLIAIVPLLVGCTAFAEERSLQSLQPVVILPKAWSTMFSVKALTGCLMALLLAVALPLAVEGASGGKELNPSILAIGVLSVWTIGLFAGSCTTGTVRAALVAVVVILVLLATWLIWNPILSSGITIGARGILGWIRIMFPELLQGDLGSTILTVFFLWTYGVVTGFLMLGFAWKLGRSPTVTRKQIIIATAVIVTLTTPLAGLVRESMNVTSLPSQSTH